MAPRAHRLSQHVRPISYAIDIATHPGRADFAGRLEIQLELLRPSDRLELHSKDLDLSDVSIHQADRQESPRVELIKETESVVFVTAQPLAVGPATLRLAFRGRPNPGMHGLYLAHDGEERAVCTQCEATDARAIFPCFDEPELKATFAWTIRTEGDVVALANGELLSTEKNGAETIWRFAPTERISSYLVALAVGHFESTEETKVGTTPIRIWAPVGKKEQGRFAHGFTEKLIPWYERYFDLPYAYHKYDQVGVPGFDAGAMENVGLVLFRQNLLLMDPRAASWNQEKLIAKVIAHELAHMWFGNLVTMSWWDDLWLNEAFAEWFAHKGTHAVAPSYLVWNDFQGDKNRALIDDALPTTHPIWSPVSTPGEALEMFDVITYQKGCAVMRMLEHFLGEVPFRDGLRTYMKAFREKNAKGADLWHHLAASSGQPVERLMESWVAQPGFPLLELELDGAQLHLKQRRFFSSPVASQGPNEQLWNIPVVVRYEDDEGLKEHRFIGDQPNFSTTLPAKGVVRWVYGNADEIGFYRVATGPKATAALLQRGLDRLTAVEQMGFVEDQWALVRNGTSGIAQFFPVLERFATSRDHNVLRSVTDRLSAIEALLEERGEEQTLGFLRQRIRGLFQPILSDLGYVPRVGEAQNELQRRALAIHAVSSLGRAPQAIAEAIHWADLERRDPRGVDPNLAGTFVGIAAKFGDAARYQDFVATYQDRKAKGSAPQDSLRYLYALAAFRGASEVKATLQHLDDGVIPQEALGSVLSQLLSTRHGQEEAWNYLKAGWSTLKSRVGDMGVSRVVESTGRLDGRFRADIVAFFEANPPTSAERALARALESLDQREELKARLVPELVRLLAIPD